MATDELPAKLPPGPAGADDAGYTRLKQFTRVSEDELMELHCVGRKAIGRSMMSFKPRAGRSHTSSLLHGRS
jgi:hypothetical protein